MALCYVIGAGDFTPRGLCRTDGDLILAADGGYGALLAHGIQPDLIVGDFDSLGRVPEDPRVLAFPPEKDDTDMALAVWMGWDRGYREFRLYGGSGDRPDHELANLQLLSAVTRRGGSAALVAPRYTVYCVTDGTLDLEAKPAGTTVSVFCQGERAEGVTLQGLKYALQDASLQGHVALGVSNEMTGAPARISVARGTLWVFVYEAPEAK